MRQGEQAGSAASRVRRPRRVTRLLGAAGLALALGIGPGLARAGANPDPGARLPEGEDGSEHWDLVVRLDSGHLVFARFLVTNLGPGERNGVAVGQIVRPDGSVKKFRNARGWRQWALSPDRRRLDVLSSRLELREPSYRLEIDKDSVRLDLRFPPAGARTPPDGAVPEAYGLDLLALGAPVTGSLWLKPMAEALAVEGTATLTHAWTDRREEEAFLRQVEVFVDGPDGGAYLTEFLLPGGERRRWLAAGAADAASSEGPLLLELGEPRPGGDAGTAGLVPGTLEIGAAGLRGRLTVGAPLLEYDPLEELPQPWRLLASARLQPRRVWLRASGALSAASPPDASPAGRAPPPLLAVTFPNLLALP